MPTQAPPLPAVERDVTPDPVADQLVAFFEDVLLGDTDWRLAEVRRVIDMHELAAAGHWETDLLAS
jgi:hypothetical protein